MALRKSPSDYPPRPFPQSELHPTDVWIVVIRQAHHSEKDMSQACCFLFYTEEEAIQKARSHVENLVFMGQYHIAKQYATNGGRNGTRRSS